MLAFVGEIPEGKQVAHNDGNPANNWLSNLRYATPEENQNDKSKHGTTLKGSAVPSSKLSEWEVLAIRGLCALGISYSKVGKIYATHRSNIFAIKQGRSWAHI